MTRALLRHLANETSKLQQAGLYKQEVADERDAPSGSIDFTSGDVLGLEHRPEVADAAVAAIREHGPGRSSPRLFGGTLSIHQRLEARVASLIGVPEAIVYASGYLGNVGLFDTMFDARDCILVDAAVHPSLAEGIRLSGARALPYVSEDLESLDDRLRRSRTARFRVVVTDGVFPLSGNLAPLGELCDLADRYDALVVVYDALGVGVLGDGQGGSVEKWGVAGRVDLVTGTFVDVLGGAGGGYVAGRPEMISWLRQKSTPYLFSGALPPGNAAAAQAAIELVSSGQAPAREVLALTTAFKEQLEGRGFDVQGDGHAILTVVVGNAVTLQRMVNQLGELDVRVQGMCYPVVPENMARIQFRITAAHTEAVLSTAVERLAQAAQTLHLL